VTDTRRHKHQIPTGLIVTGPNIASQELLFSQIATTLESETNSLVVILRSMDASNLKTVLKKLIRNATNQKGDDDDDAQMTSHQNVSYCSNCLDAF
jgi:origin recognition complex subunit 3